MRILANTYVAVIHFPAIVIPRRQFACNSERRRTLHREFLLRVALFAFSLRTPCCVRITPVQGCRIRGFFRIFRISQDGRQDPDHPEYREWTFGVLNWAS